MIADFDIVFDFPCSKTFREFESEINGESFHRIMPFQKAWAPLNEEDFIKKPIGLKIIEDILGVSWTSYTREKQETQNKPKPKMKVTPL